MEAVARAVENDPSRIGCKDKDQHFRPVLSIAVENQHIDIVELLLAAGANPNQRDAIGQSPMELAVRIGHLEIVKLLASAGASEVKSSERLLCTITVARNRCHTQIQEFLESIRKESLEGY